MSESGGEVTHLLRRWSTGDRAALDDLAAKVDAELHRLARAFLSRERPGHTLQVTALVNEAWLKLVDQTQVDFRDRSHFFAVASRIIRHILVDHARTRQREKRGGNVQKLSLNESIDFAGSRDVELVALDDAMRDLAKLDERQCKVVELRFFGGLSVEETAEVLGISPTTANRDWVTARAWLMRELARGR